MKKSIILFFLLWAAGLPAHGEEILFKNGNVKICTLLDRTGQTVVLDCGDAAVERHPLQDIQSINGKTPFPIDDQLLTWIRARQSVQTAMPLSFDIRDEEKASSYEHMGKQDSVTGIIERLIVEEGISIYDAAVRQIVLTMVGGVQNIKAAYIPIQIYWDGRLRQLINIRAGYPSQPFIYDPKNPEAVSSDLQQIGQRGFIFRIINAHGLYDSKDPLDGKERFIGFPNWPTVHWEDWKPISGENAWIVIAAMHLYHKRYLPGNPGGTGPSPEPTELCLAKEIARAAQFLQAANGGIRMAPIGTYSPIVSIDHTANLEDIAQTLDAMANYQPSESEAPVIKDGIMIKNRGLPEELTWYYNEISTENNLSWYTAFRMLFQTTGDPAYREAMKGIERYLKTVWDPAGHYFYQGMHFQSNGWVPNTEHFATDVQNWALAAIGPATIDSWFGEGASYQLWKNTKQTAGVFEKTDILNGVGFTAENDRLSIEWTVGAIFAARTLASYYKETHPDWAAEAARDAQAMRQGIESFRIKVSKQEAAYSYSSRRGWIPFGWFSHSPSILSLVSTCWVILADADFNPFFLPEAPSPFILSAGFPETETK